MWHLRQSGRKRKGYVLRSVRLERHPAPVSATVLVSLRHTGVGPGKRLLFWLLKTAMAQFTSLALSSLSWKFKYLKACALILL